MVNPALGPIFPVLPGESRHCDRRGNSGQRRPADRAARRLIGTVSAPNAPLIGIVNAAEHPPGPKGELSSGYYLSAGTMTREEDGSPVPELTRRKRNDHLL
jgi:hypothetical protein